MSLEMTDSLYRNNFILADFLDKPDITVSYSAFELYNELKKPFQRVLRNKIHKGQLDADKLERERLLNMFGLRRVEMNNITTTSILSKVDTLLKEVNVNDIGHF